LQPRAGGNSVPVRANAVVVRQTGPRLLPLRRGNAVLQGELIARFTIQAGGPGANRQPEPAFASCFQRLDLDVAGQSGGFDFFPFHVVGDDGWRAALRAGLRPADLIFPLPRPHCALSRRIADPLRCSTEYLCRELSLNLTVAHKRRKLKTNWKLNFMKTKTILIIALAAGLGGSAVLIAPHRLLAATTFDGVITENDAAGSAATSGGGQQ